VSTQHNNEEFLTLTQAAEMLNIGKFTLYKLRRKGVFHDVYIGGGVPELSPGRGSKLVRIAKSEIMASMEASKK
jgi:hypothetical protein